jgi:predicted GTPase
MQQQEEEKKGPEQLNIKEEAQGSGEKALNVLLIGVSGSGKSSLINYLAGKTLALVGDSGNSCTMDNMFYEVTLLNKKLRIFDTQGFNDTATSFTDSNGDVASRIKF